MNTVKEGASANKGQPFSHRSRSLENVTEKSLRENVTKNNEIIKGQLLGIQTDLLKCNYGHNFSKYKKAKNISGNNLTWSRSREE